VKPTAVLGQKFHVSDGINVAFQSENMNLVGKTDFLEELEGHPWGVKGKRYVWQHV
jgi:hypothetical protein